MGEARGVQAWASSVNKTGGILGKQVKIVVENDNSSPATAALLVRKCVTQDHANFLVGPESGNLAAAAVPVANQLQTIMVVVGSGWANLGLSQADLHGYAFPLNADIYQTFATSMVKAIIAPNHYTRVAVLQAAGPSTSDVTAYVKSLSSEYHFQVVASATVQPGSTNDAPQVLDLLNAKPQAIVLGLSPGTDTVTGLKAIRADNTTIPVGLCASCTSPSFIASMGGGKNLENTYLAGTAQQFIDSAPKGNAEIDEMVADTKAYLAALKAVGYTSQDDLTQDYIGYNAGEELQNAIETAKSLNSGAVKTAFQHQRIVLGGPKGLVMERTPQQYDNLADVVLAIAVVNAQGKMSVYKVD